MSSGLRLLCMCANDTMKLVLGKPSWCKYLPYLKPSPARHSFTVVCISGFSHAGDNNSSTVVSYIDERTERSEVAMAFVYCDYGDPRTRSEVEILSSITRQLAEQCRPLPPELKAFRDKYTAKVTRPTADERASLIRSLAQHFKRTYVLVDALVMTILGIRLLLRRLDD